MRILGSALFAVIFATSIFAPLACVAAADHPNVLLILVDDLGYGDLSCYGAKDLQTPKIDRLFSQGMRWDNFYANCPVCSPTRASVLTGRYPELVGVPGVIRTYPSDNWGFLDPDSPLMSDVFQSLGYDTACIGKWHLGLKSPNHPSDRGFDLFHGFLGDMMDDYYKHRRHDINYMRRNRQAIDPPGHATDLFTQWACEYLHERESGAKPFFLYLAYNAPHTPIQPPLDWLEKVKTRNPDITDRRARLVALIEHLDDSIGTVLKALDESELADDTLVIFTSDNGGQLNAGANNGDLRDGKQSMYEGGLKVPMCVRLPGRIASNSRAASAGMTMDLLPTLIGMTGAKSEAAMDGTSLWKVMSGQQDGLPARDLYFHRREGGDRFGGLTISAMRRGPWKLLQNSPWEPLELYNLDKDPREATNLAKDKRHRKMFRELSKALRAHVQRGGAVPWQRPDVRDRKK